jgi:4-amino-4-deoxy-L-arabinose transferase-like glycosyltransferase
VQVKDPKYILLTLILAIMTFLRFYNIPPIIFPDAGTYTAVAKSILIGKGFSYIFFPDNPPLGGNPPGYPIVIAACLLISGSNEYIFMGKFISLICGTILFIPTYLVGKKLFNRSVGLLSAILVITNNYIFVFSRLSLTESIFSYYFILIMYLVLLFEEKTNKQKEILIAISFLSGIAAVTRIVGYMIFFSFLFYLVLSIKKMQKQLVLSSLSIITFIMTLAFWWARNILLFNNIELLYNIGALGWTMNNGNIIKHLLLGLYNYTLFFGAVTFGRESILYLYENYLILAAIALIFTIFTCIYGLKSILHKNGSVYVYLTSVLFIIVYIWWFQALVRFLVPFIPIITVLIVGSLTKINLPFQTKMIKLPIHTKTISILAICSLIILSNVISVATSIQRQEIPFTVIAGKWLKENTDPDATIYTSLYSEIYVYSERKCIAPLSTTDHSKMINHILSKEVDFIVAHPADSRLSWLSDQNEEVPNILIIEYKDDDLKLIIFSVAS